MNITLVLGYLALGGTERQVSHLANGLVAAGHQVDVLLLRSTQSADYPLDERVTVTSLNFTKPGFRLAAWRRIRQAFKQSDVVYSLLDIANLVCALYKPLNGAPLVWGMRASNTSVSRFAETVLLLLRLLQPRARRAIANATPVANYYQSRSFNRLDFEVVPNGLQVDHSLQRTPEVRNLLLQRFDIPQDAQVALLLARVAPEKRQDLALPILAHCPNLYVLFCGQGSEQLAPRWQQSSPEASQQAVLQRCRFVPHQDNVRPLLLGADLLLCTSDAEGFPNAVGEAMAHQLPVVATAAGAIPELLNVSHTSAEPCGWVAPCGDAVALAQAVAECCTQPALAARRASLAQQRIRHRYSISTMVENTMEVLGRAAS